MEKRIIKRIRAFTLVELVVVISIIGLVIAIMLPSLGRARSKAKAIVCVSNVRQLGIAWTCYTGDYDGFAMPGAETSKNIYWWGKVKADGIDHKEGFIWPYLKSGLKEGGVYECPEQRFGSYGLQGKPLAEPDDKKWITSTYGYNGYYLSSPQSGWPDTEDRPWQKIGTVKGPDKVFAFADTLIDLGLTGGIKNTALLDPPDRYEKNGQICSWVKNEYPTTCFRHNDKVNVAFVDGHCGSMDLEGAQYVSARAKIGSAGVENSPHYVPDWREWPTSVGGRRRH
jgi:prepilin-type processing-associated H-X9-DG protein/prepilin-type N-terminal cleavage/methylation domain-containing protein